MPLIARFQSFPDCYVLPHKLKRAYRLLGEAIPFGLGSAFARLIARYTGVSSVPFSSNSAVSKIQTPDTLLLGKNEMQ